jgi:hypothetical protein
VSYQLDPTTNEIVISGFEQGVAASPYKGIGNIRNLNTSYYPGSAYVNYRRQAATLAGGTSEQLIDTYSETNYTASYPLYGVNTSFVKALVIGGGGGGGGFIGGGGGGGGFLYDASHSVTAQAYSITVGSGGAGGVQGVSSGVNGANSVFDTMTALGGGAGGDSSYSALNGGSGGGARGSNTVGTGSQGYNGGNSSFSNTAGGGGGSGAVGVQGNSSNSGNGGAGKSNSISGSAVYYAGGGGGGGSQGDSLPPGNGVNGGGNGGVGATGGAGTANTGGGGGGGGANGGTGGPGGAGGSGVVIISYPTGTLTATGGTITTSGGNTIHTFTSSGTWTVTLAGSQKYLSQIFFNEAPHSTFNQAKFYLSKTGTPSGNMVANLYSVQTVSSILVPNAVLVSSTAINANTLTGTPTLTTFTFPTTSLALDTYYFIGLSFTGGDASDKVNVGYGSTTEYIPNVSLYSIDGSTWNQNTSPTANNLIYYTLYSEVVASMGVPIQSATSPAGLNYILDNNGNIWKQNSVNSSTFTLLGSGANRYTQGNGGLAYWNNYLVVIGAGLIEFCGDGTGDSTITSANWNLNTANFFQNKTAFTALQFQCTGAIAPGATTATLSANWAYPTNTNATIIFGDGEVRTGITVTNGSPSLSWTGGLTNLVSSLVFISSPEVYFSNPNYTVTSGQQIVFTGTTLPSPLVAGTTYYATSNSAAISGGYSFSLSANPGGSNIILNSLGTGSIYFSVSPKTFLPLGNVTNLTFTGDLTAGDTSATISSYTLPNGVLVGAVWLLPTGIYNVIDSNGNNILANFTNSSSAVTFTAPISEYATGNYSVQILNPNTANRTYVSQVDGNLYYANGESMGALIIAESNVLFNPGDAATYTVEYSVFELGTASNFGSDSIVDMVDLQDNMVVAGQSHIYSWDYTSSYTNAPVPVEPGIKRVLNNLNIVYVFAGQKGNIYTSNGSYAQLLTKIPDYIAGAIDPVWTYGGVMTHRSKVWFQALAQDTSGNNLLQGIFSIIVSPSLLGETAQGIVMESQNSAGLIPASGTVGNGILIDNEPSSTGYDSYYSAYSTGGTSGLIDYNNTSVWQNYEPVIETDIIPVGSLLGKKTFGQTQFKLDRQMVSGDAIRLYGRASLSDSWTLIGTTTTTVLSDAYPSNLSQVQWIQYRAELKGSSGTSSRLPLTEIRVQAV